MMLLAVACGGDADPADDAATDGAMAVEDSTPVAPRVTAINMAIAVDDNGQLMGAGVETFPNPDTLHVAVRTEGTTTGTPIAVRLRQGEITMDSTSTESAALAAGVATTTVAFPAAAGLPPGAYQVEVFLDGVSAGIREFRFNAP